ncbi:MAG: hypothetical protein LBQ79_12710 [Deltaproteobacteria bacterium]|jgi:hypothetical protein|nr:hypothetical protein [Deltaproteobacteria bacterium]
MSQDKFYSLVDKVSRGIIRSVEEIDRELAEMPDGEAESVRKILPAIVLSIAVLRLCQENPPDEVLNILKAVSTKVETGDYHPGGMSFRDDEPYEPPVMDPDDDTERNGNNGSGGNGTKGKGPTIN